MQTKPKHTPGPWNVGLWSFQNIRDPQAIFANGCRIPICQSIMGGDLEEADANAALIAAAPQLLATLEKVSAYWAGGDVPADLHAEMLAVIRQAKGEA
jgi:hypothetical protein